MRVLVAGGNGFLGKKLVDSLLKNGAEVFSLNRTRPQAAQKLDSPEIHPNLHLLFQDVSSPINEPVNAVYNLASPASPAQHDADPFQTIRTNVEGSMALLEFAALHNASILQASTSEVYGNPNVSPQHEDYFGNVDPVGKRASYTESKRLAETIFFEHNRIYGTRIRIARIFSTYGPGMRIGDGRAISNFVVQALRNEPLTIYGDGAQVRSFTYVDDIVNGMEMMMASTSPLLGPMNLGDTHKISLLELAELVIQLSKSQSKIEFREQNVMSSIELVPDISLAREQIDWQPRVSLVDGLLRTIEDFSLRFRS